jgi:hypothetical protein
VQGVWPGDDVITRESPYVCTTGLGLTVVGLHADWPVLLYSLAQNC